MRSMNPVKMKQVVVEDAFWSLRQRQVREVVVPYQWEALNDLVPGAEPSRTIANFRIAAGVAAGDFYGHVFQDSDLAKWLETVGFVLQQNRDEALEQLADEAFDLVGRAQQADGYFNTYYQIKHPGEQWTNVRDDHEMYVAGHFMEAAVAYYEATGKPQALDIMRKFADHLASVFGSGEGQRPGYCGHPEIELALVKLYRATGERKYLNLSRFFVEERGREPHYFTRELEERRRLGKTERVGLRPMYYFQAHAPIREQHDAEGHAVRAVYLYSGATDIADEFGDASLLEAMKRLWDNTVNRRMYVTGGIGSSDYYEDFSFDYDLPNERAYAESCASVGLFVWGHRLLMIEADSRYADVMERTLYNGLLSGISLDGRSYFYLNPLEAWPTITGKRYDIANTRTQREPWFGCACCPPNIARLIASLGDYIYSASADELYVHLYVGSSVRQTVAGSEIGLTLRTNYPWEGEVSLELDLTQPAAFALALRRPGWCERLSVLVNGEELDDALISPADRGYIKLRRLWLPGDRVELRMDMPVLKVRSHPELREANGKMALQRGPIVYCLEEKDNGGNLRDLELSGQADVRARFESHLLGGVCVLESDDAYRTDRSAVEPELYTTKRYPKVPAALRAIPYYAWANRGEGEMAVWIRERS